MAKVFVFDIYYLDIYISEHRLFQLIHSGNDLNEELKRLSSLLEQCAHYPDISFDAQVQVVDLLGRVISNNPEFELLVDRIAKISAARESEVQGALIHFNRADTLIRKEDYLPAIKHLGHCVQAFLKEGCDLTCGSGITNEYIYAYENVLDKLTELKKGE